MRDIKFRGYSKALNKWVYGDLLDENIIVKGIVEINDDEVLIERWAVVVPKSVGQYTGLKDMTGVEIYEGDICWEENNERPGTIEFYEGAFGYISENDYEELGEINKEIEVIGNIYEN